MISCSKGKHISTISVDAKILPSMHAERVSTLISDSGVTRYRMVTDVWDMYSNEVEPYSYFPQGIYLEKFDSLFNTIGFLQADTAYYFDKKDLWQLIGNVHVQNLEGDKFDTSELFWNGKEPANSINAIYTDKPIRVDQGGDIIISKGLNSDQYMKHIVTHDFYSEAFVSEDESNEDVTQNE